MTSEGSNSLRLLLWCDTNNKLGLLCGRVPPHFYIGHRSRGAYNVGFLVWACALVTWNIWATDVVERTSSMAPFGICCTIFRPLYAFPWFLSVLYRMSVCPMLNLDKRWWGHFLFQIIILFVILFLQWLRVQWLKGFQTLPPGVSFPKMMSLINTCFPGSISSGPAVLGPIAICTHLAKPLLSSHPNGFLSSSPLSSVQAQPSLWAPKFYH